REATPAGRGGRCVVGYGVASLRRFLVLPRVIWYLARAPRDRTQAWETYWRGIDGGGPDGDVLWDAGTDRELSRCRDQAVTHLHRDLPVVDVACGNGTQAVLLADHFPMVVGIDVSAEAVARARQRAARRTSVSFRVLDVTRPGVGRALAAEIGPANVHIRGLLHVLDDAERRAVAANLADVVGDSGVVLLMETAFAGGALGYLERLGARLTEFPQTVARLLRAGVPVPREFDQKQLARSFPSDVWQVLDSGTTELDVVTTPTAGEGASVPAFFAVLRRRTDAAEEIGPRI
ncbi:MAG TPA: class I SAM-dependent methyltransferase, partial [Actinoplanes sp.]